MSVCKHVCICVCMGVRVCASERNNKEDRENEILNKALAKILALGRRSQAEWQRC